MVLKVKEMDIRADKCMQHDDNANKDRYVWNVAMSRVARGRR